MNNFLGVDIVASLWIVDIEHVLPKSSAYVHRFTIDSQRSFQTSSLYVLKVTSWYRIIYFIDR